MFNRRDSQQCCRRISAIREELGRVAFSGYTVRGRDEHPTRAVRPNHTCVLFGQAGSAQESGDKQNSKLSTPSFGLSTLGPTIPAHHVPKEITLHHRNDMHDFTEIFADPQIMVDPTHVPIHTAQHLVLLSAAIYGCLGRTVGLHVRLRMSVGPAV